MSCTEITVALISISICHPAASPGGLPGRWVGAVQWGGEVRAVRAEFVRGPAGVTGLIHVEGKGDLPLVEADESRNHVHLEAPGFIFLGSFQDDAITGLMLHAGQRLPFELHRTVYVQGKARGRSATGA